MLWATPPTGLTVFTYLVGLTVVTVAIPYLFSACAQLAYLVSRRRRVHGWALARRPAIAGCQHPVLDVGHLRRRLPGRLPGDRAALAGIPIYAFLKARRERLGLCAEPIELTATPTRSNAAMTSLGVHSEVGRLRQVILHRPGLELNRLTPTNIDDCSSTTCCGSSGPARSTTRSPRCCATQGVEVHLLRQLLAETLEHAGGPRLHPRPGVSPRDGRPVAGRSAPRAARRRSTGRAGRVPRRRHDQARPAAGHGARACIW